MNYPTIKQLRYYIALVEKNHFGQAASSCFVSQSAFSVAIKELETTLNGQLVDRTNKSVTVTSLGREVYSQAKIVMTELSELVNISQGNKEPLSSKLSLGIIPTIAPFLLSQFIFKLQDTHKDLELYLNEDITQNLYNKLIRGDLDVLLIALPYALKNVETFSLFRDKFYLTYSPASKWIEKKGKSIRVTDDSILLLEDGHCMRDHTLSACKIKNQNKISHYSASSILTLIEMVKIDVGVTYLPEMSLDSVMLKNTNLMTQEVENGYRDIGLVWRKGSSRSKEFELLGQFIKSNVL